MHFNDQPNSYAHMKYSFIFENLWERTHTTHKIAFVVFAKDLFMRSTWLLACFTNWTNMENWAAQDLNKENKTLLTDTDTFKRNRFLLQNSWRWDIDVSWMQTFIFYVLRSILCDYLLLFLVIYIFVASYSFTSIWKSYASLISCLHIKIMLIMEPTNLMNIILTG